jgi:hypothetical protein
MIHRVFILFITALLLSTIVLAQQPSQGSRSSSSNPNNTFPGSSDQEINLPDEMRSRLIIERLEGEHKKFVEDVKKLDELSSEVTRSFIERKLLSSEDLKKLGSIEKLARRILSHAGGNQVDDKSDDSSQIPLNEAIEKLNVAVAGIKKVALTETRHVVSAAVIGNSNEIIDLTRAMRRSQKQNN